MAAPPAPPATIVEAPAAAVAEVSIEPAQGATCIVHDTKGSFWGLVTVFFHGKPFASFERFGEAELRASASAMTLTVATDDVIVTGEAKRETLDVRPRKNELVEGWLAVRRATPKAIAGDAMSLQVSLPSIVKAAEPSITVPCSELSFAIAKDADPSGKVVHLKEGLQAPLRAAPGGPVVARIETPAKPKPKPKQRAATPGAAAELAGLDLLLASEQYHRLMAEELARQGKAVQLRIDGGASFVEGWVDATALGPAKTDGLAMSLLAKLGPTKPAGPALRCPHEVAIYLRDGEGATKVGAFRARGAIRQVGPVNPNAKDEVPVHVGMQRSLIVAPVDGRDDGLQPFVRSSALEGCAFEKN